jgi:hypothetical protein
MKRLLVVGILFSTVAFTFQKWNATSSEPLTDLPLNWSAPIGNVSFRTNIDFLDDQLVIGSNGGNYMDYFVDKGNGIYILDPKSGKIQLNFANESFGDMDVNGVLVYQNKIYFGNDNDEIICADKNGKIIFRQDASGDIEHRPILIKTPSKDQIVFAMETGEIRAVDPSNGNIYWTFYHPDFEGQKVGDNRVAFKLRMHFYSGEKFFVEPVLNDINKDGILDLIYTADHSEVFIIDGKNGNLITSIEHKNSNGYFGNYHCGLFRVPPAILEIGKEKFIAIPFFKRFEKDPKGNQNINEIRLYNTSGKEVKVISFNSEVDIDDMQQFGNRLFFRNHWVDFSDGVDNYTVNTYSSMKIKNYNYNRVSKNSISINGDECVIMCFEFGLREDDDYSNSTIGIYNLRTKSFEKLHHLKVTSEFVPVLGDFNKDNKADILIGCHDGMLYNLDLGYPASSINK